jgi:hypothetical protein
VFLVQAALLLSACAAPSLQPTLTFEQHTLRIPLTVEADGTVSLAERPPLVGRIDLSPILEAEGIRGPARTAATIQMVVHYGRYYVVGDGFRAIWQITPRPGTSSGAYRPIQVVRDADREPLKDVRLSPYGSSESSCLRLDRAAGTPVFITRDAEARDECP